MQIAKFYDLVHNEFGESNGEWLLRSHIIEEFGTTAKDLLEQGYDLRKVWWALCRDFDVPKERWLGEDI
ncbi:DUF3046 domain-containing protein [Corynebacterium freiburgense]|uniref:DUF3046 domain-containing protein n=1 Tax=Corynebacterium freiburgense TaxID=556548 RepID=UPI00047CD66E|nr:DUF3046 domain-containing protein [Corynebacterium freiburgense]WJZ02913.1 hypothetical protein CFREI_08175 [Corynebacterium freiburgense]